MESTARKPKGHVWKEIVSPILALVVICGAMSFALAMTNEMTAPLIEENTRKAAEEARAALLPEADGFVQLEITAEVPGVTALWGATNDAGYVVECYGTGGYGGDIPAMVAFTPEGTIVGVVYLQNNETPGLGKKLESDPSFAAQFTGLPADPVQTDQIDKIASSTISTNAAIAAVNAAIELYNQEIHGQSVDALAAASGQGEGAEE
ncbi:FMN-binding protein [Ruminococcaceae bacterium OttesenSCG-928-I18]|nr:FMN-binding protein [Ruminococcaceae bacterium OttesenSCG-928-I18]